MYVVRRFGVNTIRIFQKIESSDLHIEGLDKYIGKDAEITILIDDLSENDRESKKKKADEFILNYSGKVAKWNREELYDR